MYGVADGACPNFSTTIKCHYDVSPQLDKECKEKEECKVKVDDASFSDKKL